MLKFSVPTNWQEDLIPKLNKNFIEELYGKLPQDIVGGGRASVVLPHVSRNNAARHIADAKSFGIKFNYLLNATCLDNLEWTRSWQNRFRKFLEYLIKIKVDKVTVSVPYLLELIKKSYPGFNVSVSVQAGTASLRQARLWENLGADEITLFMDTNRDFPLLRLLKKQVHCKFKAIANLACLYGCPFYHYHANLQSHASQKSHPSAGFVIDYCTLRCRSVRLSNPEEFIKSRWIRPEDLKVYEDIGIDTLKFVNRDMKTEAICLIVDAYSNREYKGNLLDLFSDPSKSLNGSSAFWNKIRYLFKPSKINPFKLYKARALLAENRTRIDNNKLGGFLEFFLSQDCSLIDCESCGYCRSVAEKVLEFPLGYQKIFKDKYDGFLGRLINSDLFK